MGSARGEGASARHRTTALAPLRRRNFAVVWTGSSVSNIGTWMQAAGLGYYTVHLTNSAGWGAAVAAAEFAPTALLGPIGGAIADRYSRRTIFLVATLAQAILAGALTVAMVSGRPGAPVIALYALANGCVFALRSDFDASIDEQASPGSYLSRQLIERLFGQNLQRYYMGPGQNPYKYRWNQGVLPNFGMTASATLCADVCFALGSAG